jgi:hypothetical protein
LREACREPDGLISDYRILGKPWNLNLSNLRIPIRKYLSDHIPQAKLIRLNGLNHYASLIEKFFFIYLKGTIKFMATEVRTGGHKKELCR